jgi:malonyl-CoA/methylmalonyl-CoA synthetase
MPSPSSNVYTALSQAFPADLESTAVETDTGLFYTWRDLDRGSAMLANYLQSLGLPADARILVQVEKVG